MADPGRILVTLSTFGDADPAPRQLLDASPYPVTINPHGRRLRPQEVVELGRDAVGIVAGVEPYDAATLAQLTNLRCLSRCGIGLDSIDLDAAQARGIRVCNTPDEPVDAVAEHTVALMFSMLRHVPAVDAATRGRAWQRITGTLLSGKTVGIVGLGRIGRRVAELLAPFHVTLLGTDPVAADPTWCRSAGVRVVPLEELLSSSHVITLHATSPPGARPLIDGEQLARFRPAAWLINTARGALVDEAALADALRSGRLSGAGLDVFGTEPYTGPLCDLENVVLTPHQATLTVETRAAMELRAVQNLLALLSQVVVR